MNRNILFKADSAPGTGPTKSTVAASPTPPTPTPTPPTPTPDAKAEAKAAEAERKLAAEIVELCAVNVRLAEENTRLKEQVTLEFERAERLAVRIGEERDQNLTLEGELINERKKLTALEAADKQRAADEAVIAEKMLRGMTRAQAIQVIERQRAFDAQKVQAEKTATTKK